MNIYNLSGYDRAIAVVRDLPTFLARNRKIMSAFHDETRMWLPDVLPLLKTDARPDIIPVPNLTNSSGDAIWGNTPLHGNTIKIRQNLIWGLEEAKLKSTVYNTAFLLAVTLVHELVHYCRNHNKIKEDGYEHGNSFEWNAFNNYVDDNNAAFINRYQDNFHHLESTMQNDPKVINDIHRY